MKTFSRLRISSTFPNFSFEEGFAASYHSQRGIQRRLLQAIFIAKTSKYAESREEAGLTAMPWPPGSMSEPSCSQGSWGTSPPELLLYLPDLTSSQLSFVLLGVGADLTHSWVQDSASGPLHHRVLHATWSLLSSGTRTRCCCFPQCFPTG